MKRIEWKAPLLLWVLFEGIAVTGLALGVLLYLNRRPAARNVTQWIIGVYMLVYLGLMKGENMQLEGFWYYLFQGVFEAAVIHYLIAKIAGPLIFGRGWCGYACWTAMVLDLLPYKTRCAPRRRWTWMRYAVFVLSLLFVTALVAFRVQPLERIMQWSFVIGNLLYYAVGITLALVLKDNRAFCKYLCPVAVFLKPASYFSRLRVTCDNTACISCGKCRSVCPMDVDMTDNARSRLHGTECILCLRCVETCPQKALKC